jgi:hypothetical protein
MCEDNLTTEHASISPLNRGEWHDPEKFFKKPD